MARGVISVLRPQHTPLVTATLLDIAPLSLPRPASQTDAKRDTSKNPMRVRSRAGRCSLALRVAGRHSVVSSPTRVGHAQALPNIPPSSRLQEIRVEKLVINISTGQSGDRLTYAARVLEQLTGQKPLLGRARYTVRQFSIRVRTPTAAGDGLGGACSGRGGEAR